MAVSRGEGFSEMFTVLLELQEIMIEILNSPSLINCQAEVTRNYAYHLILLFDRQSVRKSSEIFSCLCVYRRQRTYRARSKYIWAGPKKVSL